ncbi:MULTISPECIES: 50S ribosomal protein L24 [Lactobacillaceae]|uniref:50S ribosomal protein L24 n=1 Tax=Lactobacillaceae TaxID=33958 RepID=UPI000C1B602D|nr:MULTISPECIES: 50S ribosomal protein L24 [Lactobacillaceae]
MFVKTGDNVQILAGDDKGKQGLVKKAMPSTNQVIVAGMNIVKKHSKPSNTQPQGGIIDVEMPISATNVKVVKGSAKAATKETEDK